MKPAGFLEAARVPLTLEPQLAGPWAIERHAIHANDLAAVGWPSMTILRRLPTRRRTDPYASEVSCATFDRGEVVMEDSRRELSRHLPIWLAARGRVLVTGLGLGCVVRGLLASPDVEQIDVVEIDLNIMRTVGPEFEGNPRVRLHLGDALKVEWSPGARWDYAWHDIWADRDAGQPHLQVLHVRLLQKYRALAPKQGAWMLPRWAKRRARVELGGEARCRR